MLLCGGLGSRTEPGGGEAARLGGLLAAGFATGLLLGHPISAAALAVAIWAAWRLAGFPGVFAVSVGAFALASASIHDVKSAFADERWVVLGTLALWPTVSRRAPAIRVPVTLIVAATTLGAVAFASAAWSVDPGLTLRRAATFGVLLWVAFVVVPLHASQASERRRLAFCLAVLCVAGAAAAVVAAVAAPWLAKATPGAFAYSNGLPAVPRIGPLQGWLESPNTLGLWCALLVPFALTLRSRAVAIPCVVLAVGVILWSYSRAALIVLLLALAWQARPLVSRRVVIAVAVLIAAIALGPARSTISTNTALTKFQRAGSNERSLLGGRLEAWNASLELIEAAPLSGFGFGTGDRLFNLSGADGRFIYYIGSNPSSGYLQALEEVGPLGAIAILAALTAGLMAGWRRRRHNGGGMPFLVVGFSFAVIGVSESIFTSPGSPFALLLWSSLALASAGVPSFPLRSGPAPRDEDVVAREVRLAAETLAEEPVVAPNGRRAEPRHAPSRGSPGVRS